MPIEDPIQIFETVQNNDPIQHADRIQKNDSVQKLNSVQSVDGRIEYVGEVQEVLVVKGCRRRLPQHLRQDGDTPLEPGNPYRRYLYCLVYEKRKPKRWLPHTGGLATTSAFISSAPLYM